NINPGIAIVNSRRGTEPSGNSSGSSSQCRIITGSFYLTCYQTVTHCRVINLSRQTAYCLGSFYINVLQRYLFYGASRYDTGQTTYLVGTAVDSEIAEIYFLDHRAADLVCQEAFLGISG